MNNPESPDFTEDLISKLPALHLLQNLGYTYLPPEQSLPLRGNKTSQVILDGILTPWLRDHNRINYKARELPFEESNIQAAVQALKDIRIDGLVRTNEQVFDLLCLGKSFQQSIDGDLKSFTLKYIDWEHPENNVFHVTEEFTVEKVSHQGTREPDIVLFVNGIPFVIIECKSSHVKNAIEAAIAQHDRNQKEDEIPGLYIYGQILIALSKNQARFGTVQTPDKLWAIWREEDEAVGRSSLGELVNIPLTDEQMDQLFVRNQWLVREKPADYMINRMVTEQDRLLYALCRKERLLELVYRYTLYDNGEKKVARYQQYFCVKNILDRIKTVNAEDRREGGVIWHTQGSGKSLTMVMLAKAIALSKDIPNHRIILVTDRVDLDDQIYRTFKACSKEPVQATTGKHLGELLKAGTTEIITTVIDKFDAVLNRLDLTIEDNNIFVLVDEAHRTNYGNLHAKMRRVLPNACYLAFTGTPIAKEDKNTMVKFGGFIDTYTIDQAVADEAVVPLLYEGRHVSQRVDNEALDAWFERITADLTREQVADLKRKFSTEEQLNKAEQKVIQVAWDISEHFAKNWKTTGFKGQLVAQDKATALLYKKCLDEFGKVSSEVLISGPDELEAEADNSPESKRVVLQFWKKMMERFGTEKAYNKQVIEAFKKQDHPEIIIVVDKLLAGFDAPRNTVLYLTRKLKEHTLLQAIARVNRCHPGKEFGYILDYRGVLGELEDALEFYTSLPDFDPEDIANILADVSREIEKLPQKHSVLWDLFKTVKALGDEEAYEQLLRDEAIREDFYERLSAYARCLGVALSSEKFLAETPADKLDRYQRDLQFFMKLRLSVRQRFNYQVDFGEYEPKIQKLLDRHVSTGEAQVITPLVDIFNKEAFAKELETLTNPESKADTIAHRTAATIRVRMPEDPTFYKRFSQMLNETIQAFYEGRIKANEYLQKVLGIMEAVASRTGDELPVALKDHEDAKAYYGIIRETLEGVDEPDLLAQVYHQPLQVLKNTASGRPVILPAML